MFVGGPKGAVVYVGASFARDLLFASKARSYISHYPVSLSSASRYFAAVASVTSTGTGGGGGRLRQGLNRTLNAEGSRAA